MKTQSTKIRRSLAKGFTLLEILAATVVATILLTVSLQILGGSSETVKAADKKRNAQAQLRTALDRFAADFSTAMLTGGTTAIWKYIPKSQNTPGGSEISFLSLSRPALPTSSGSNDAPRGAAIGYALRDHQETSGGKTYTYSELMRGDAPVEFTSDLVTEFFSQIGDPGASIWKDPNGTERWEPLGTGIVRFHISFLLDDGTITQTPPAYTMISPQGTGDASFQNDLNLNGGTAIAFSERNKQRPVNGRNTDDPNNNDRYVKALIVAAAAVDRDVLVQSLKGSKLSEIDELGVPEGPKNPGDRGETPLEVWEKNLTDIDFKPLLQSIRFQQRTIPVP